MRLRGPLFITALCATAAAASTVACVESTDDVSGGGGSELNAERDVYTQNDVLPLTLSAPFAKLIDRRIHGGAPDPRPEDAGADYETTYSEPGTLTYEQDGADKVLDIRLEIRGESSLRDCPFPKLKISFTNKEQLKKTPFKSHGTMRLNTHCGPGDEKARSGMGRVFNGVGPVREELSYRMVRAMGIETYQTRLAKIRYTDTGANTDTDSFGMLFESGDDANQRFAAMTPPLVTADSKYLDPDAVRAMKMTPDNQSQVVVAEAFVGNRDWFGSHNIDSFGVLGADSIFQIPQDFDLTAISQGDIAKYPVAQLDAAKAGLTNAKTVELLRAHKDAVQAAYAQAEKAALEAGAITGAEGKTTDSGFLEANKRLEALYAFPELADAPK